MFSHSYEDLQHTVCYKLYNSWNITSKEKYTYSKGVKSSMPSHSYMTYSQMLLYVGHFLVDPVHLPRQVTGVLSDQDQMVDRQNQGSASIIFNTAILLYRNRQGCLKRLSVEGRNKKEEGRSGVQLIARLILKYNNSRVIT